ncbi:MAG: Mor transcription activator family protein [Rhodocyclaceae bacterium]|nr:Mor transcription activator family protein [Rhodocyclaceae bacterium]
MKLSLDHLPRTARDLVELLGLPATLRLVESYGGKTIDVAKGKRARGIAQILEISERIGAIAAQKLAGRYGGAPLPVPSCKRAVLAMRDAALQARFDELTGAGRSARSTVAMLVDEFGIGDSAIWRALKRPAGAAAVLAKAVDSQQTDLFA